MSEVWDTKSLYALSLVIRKYELWDQKITFSPNFETQTPILWIDCSDFFSWATADGEDLEPSDVVLLEQAAEDLRNAEKFAEVYAFDLWVCRKRKMLPMERWVVGEKLSPSVRALFESAGGSK